MIHHIEPQSHVSIDIKMLPVDFNEAKKEALRKEFSEKYGIPEKNVYVRFVQKDTNNTKQSSEITQNIIRNIQNPEFQQSLFKDYMDMRGIKNVKFEDILEIDKEVNGYVDFDSYSKYRNYKFKYIKWDNFLSYGPGNYIDFTKLHGLVLLTSDPKNQGGKTTVSTELLRFALFGKSDKSGNLDKAFNKYIPEATEVMVELGIEIDGDDYVIRRTITRPALKKRTSRSKPKQSVQYYKIVGGEKREIVNKQGASTKETDNIIKESIGSLEDFNMIISATSKNLSDLLDLGQTAKAQVFSRWLGLLTIEKKNEVAKDLYKKKVEPSLITRKGYDKATLEAEIKDFKKCIADDEKNIKDGTRRQEALAKDIDGYNESKAKLVSRMKPVKEEIARTDVTTVESHISSNTEALTTKKAVLDAQEKEYAGVKGAKFNQELYDRAVRKLDEYKAYSAELKTEIKSYKSDIERINDLIAKKVCPTCGHPVEMAEQGKLIDRDNDEINKRIALGVENKGRIDKGEAYIRQMDDAHNKLNRKYILESSMAALKSEMEVLSMKIKNDRELLKEVELNKANIKENQSLDNEMRSIDVSIRTLTSQKEELIRELESYRNDITNSKAEIKDRETLIKKLDREEVTIRNWKTYLDMVSKNGIVKIVLRKALPAINQELDRLLDGLCDFRVELSISDMNEVQLNMVRDGITLDLATAASGFELTMSALALRGALSNMSTISKPSMLCLDEVLGGVSADNYENVHELYRRLLGGYQFILHITHNEMIADWHSQGIKVVKVDNISHVEQI